MTTKEQARRASIESAWTPPKPESPEHEARPDELSAGASGLVKFARSSGFTIRTLAARSTLAPSWKRVSADDALLSFVAPVVDVVRIGGLVRPFPLQTEKLSSAYLRTMDQGELVAFEVVYIDGSARSARVLLRFGHSAKWSVEGVTAVRARIKAAGAVTP